MRTKRAKSHTCTVAVVLAALTGCAETKPKAETPETPRATAPVAVVTTEVEADIEAEPTQGAIEVDEEIARVCKLPTAHFAFDSARITGTASDVLDKLASCLGEGALANRSLNIVGHADPRGPVNYNFALGQRRAGSVSGYLVSAGIPEERLTTTSMGELEASGTDEASWARDRKVQILLAEEMVVPTQKTSARE